MATRPMRSEDLAGCSRVHNLVFGARELFSEDWIASNFAASSLKRPHIQCFVAEEEDAIAGYIFWLERGGLRRNAVLELDQIGVDPYFQGRGIGKALITESLRQVKKRLAMRGSVIGKVIISMRADNLKARALYASILNAEVEVSFRDFFTTDEVIMVTRDLPDWLCDA